jgi:hypothetical protein
MKLRIKRTVQILTLIILSPILLALYLCPYPVPFVLCRVCYIAACPFQGDRYLRMLGIYVGITSSSIAFGRAFCGWVCPVGTIQDFIHSIPLRLQTGIARHLGKGSICSLGLFCSLLQAMPCPQLLCFHFSTYSSHSSCTSGSLF